MRENRINYCFFYYFLFLGEEFFVELFFNGVLTHIEAVSIRQADVVFRKCCLGRLGGHQILKLGSTNLVAKQCIVFVKVMQQSRQ